MGVTPTSFHVVVSLASPSGIAIRPGLWPESNHESALGRSRGNCFHFLTVVMARRPRSADHVCLFSLPPCATGRLCLQVTEFPPRPREKPACLNPSSHHSTLLLPLLAAGTNFTTCVRGRRLLAGSHWTCDGEVWGRGEAQSLVLYLTPCRCSIIKHTAMSPAPQ